MVVPPIQVRPYAAEELQQYIEFAHEVYRDNRSWVPPDAHHLTGLLSGQSGFASQSEVRPFRAERSGRTVATVAAVYDEVYNRRWNEQMGHLLFFEALPDEPGAVGALFDGACAWLREQGARAVRLSLLPGWQLPLTIDAYDQVPSFFHTYNPAYYHAYVKDAGFGVEAGAVQYQVEFTETLAARYRDMLDRASADGIRFRSFDFNRPEEDTETLTDTCNETFRSHWGFMPVPSAVMRGLTADLKDLLVADFIGFAEVAGDVAGLVYATPDLNQALHPMRGRRLEEHMDEFRDRLQQVDHGVLLIIGVKEAYRGRGINLALAARSYLAMIERGYRRASYTIVLDDNWRSRRTAEKLGARVTRNFNIYRRNLPADGGRA